MPWITTTAKRGSPDQQARLHSLAGEKGYDPIHALRSDGWHLIDANGLPAKGPDGRTTFTTEQALAFLKRLAPPLAPTE
jgi:hypothetical protein